MRECALAELSGCSSVRAVSGVVVEPYQVQECGK